MSSLMFQAADALMKVASRLPLLEGEDPAPDNFTGETAVKTMAGKIWDVMYSVTPYILIVLGALGIVFGILRGVKLAKAESADQQQEAKKNLITFLIGFVVTIGLIVVVVYAVPEIIKGIWGDEVFKGTKTFTSDGGSEEGRILPIISLFQ